MIIPPGTYDAHVQLKTHDADRYLTLRPGAASRCRHGACRWESPTMTIETPPLE